MLNLWLLCFTCVLMSHYASFSYIETSETKFNCINIKDPKRGTVFSVSYPKNGDLDSLLMAVKEQRPSNPLIDEKEFQLFMGARKIEPNDMVRIFSVPYLILVTSEPQELSPLRYNLLQELQAPMDSLKRAITKLYNELPKEGTVESLPQISQNDWQLFLESVKKAYDIAHRHEYPDNKYPPELFISLLYDEIRTAAGSDNYNEHNIKRALLPEEGLILFDDGIEHILKTGANYYRSRIR